MLYLKSCPRPNCNGDINLSETIDAIVAECLQCGFRIEKITKEVVQMTSYRLAGALPVVEESFNG